MHLSLVRLLLGSTSLLPLLVASSDRFEYLIAGSNGYDAPCVSPTSESNNDVFITDDGIEYVRTPEEAFVNLTKYGYPYSPNYATVDGMRMHYVDECTSTTCDDEVILLLHGQPTSSFLYRKMIPILVDRGYRVIAPDWLGFGRSDKPVDLAEHTYLKQVERLKSFLRQVVPGVMLEEKPSLTIFVQDWGSLIGLRTVGDEPDWFRRVVVANGDLPVPPNNFELFPNPNPVNYNCSDSRSPLEMGLERITSSPCGFDRTCFQIWMKFALENPAWMPSEVVIGLATSSKEAAFSMYDVAFPTRQHMAAPRAFPSMIAAVHEPDFGNGVARENLKNFSRPFLSLAGERDRNLGSVATQNGFINNVIGATVHEFEHRRYPTAGHFIQEDVGEELAEYVADFIDGTAHLLEVPSTTAAPTAAPTAVPTAVPTLAPTTSAPTVAPVMLPATKAPVASVDATKAPVDAALVVGGKKTKKVSKTKKTATKPSFFG
mmetsp:Transcript_32971/g.49799  ORF Transcript_32971/g.49799 Transcript_32971/m.49799 type:complete len:488 (+) Transcript_32971:62-1525(+)